MERIKPEGKNKYDYYSVLGIYDRNASSEEILAHSEDLKMILEEYRIKYGNQEKGTYQILYNELLKYYRISYWKQIAKKLTSNNPAKVDDLVNDIANKESIAYTKASLEQVCGLSNEECAVIDMNVKPSDLIIDASLIPNMVSVAFNKVVFASTKLSIKDREEQISLDKQVEEYESLFNHRDRMKPVKEDTQENKKTITPASDGKYDKVEGLTFNHVDADYEYDGTTDPIVKRYEKRKEALTKIKTFLERYVLVEENHVNEDEIKGVSKNVK